MTAVVDESQAELTFEESVEEKGSYSFTVKEKTGAVLSTIKVQGFCNKRLSARYWIRIKNIR